MVSVELTDGRQVASMNQGDFFGEIALFLQAKRTASIVAATEVEVLSLSKKGSKVRCLGRVAFHSLRADVDEVMRKYPDMYAQFKKLGEERLKGDKAKKNSEVPKWMKKVLFGMFMAMA